MNDILFGEKMGKVGRNNVRHEIAKMLMAFPDIGFGSLVISHGRRSETV